MHCAAPYWPDPAISANPGPGSSVRVMFPTLFRRKNFYAIPANGFRSVFMEKWSRRFSENSEIAHIVLYTARYLF
jgi:hypothetical protein